MSNFKIIVQLSAKMFHADGRTRMTMLVVALRNFPNAPKNTTVRTNTSLQLNVPYNFPVSFQFSLPCRLLQTDSHRSPISSARPLLHSTAAHLCRRSATSQRTHDVWTHCWQHTVPSRNSCAYQRALQYCSCPCRNIRRSWTFGQPTAVTCNYERLAERNSQKHRFRRTGGLSGVTLCEQQ